MRSSVRSLSHCMVEPSYPTPSFTRSVPTGAPTSGSCLVASDRVCSCPRVSNASPVCLLRGVARPSRSRVRTLSVCYSIASYVGIFVCIASLVRMVLSAVPTRPGTWDVNEHGFDIRQTGNPSVDVFRHFVHHSPTKTSLYASLSFEIRLVFVSEPGQQHVVCDFRNIFQRHGDFLHGGFRTHLSVGTLSVPLGAFSRQVFDNGLDVAFTFA